jgi:hypothetical protein
VHHTESLFDSRLTEILRRFHLHLEGDVRLADLPFDG